MRVWERPADAVGRSWWLDLPPATFYARARVEQPRMATSRIATWIKPPMYHDAPLPGRKHRSWRAEGD